VGFGDLVFESVAAGFAFCIIALLILIAYELIAKSALSIDKFGWIFLISTTWDPVHEIFGALPFIFGTVVSSILALIIAVPLSLGVAIFLSEMAPSSVRFPISSLVELLAAVPSVIYGLWGIFVMAPILRIHVQPTLAKTLGFLPLFQGPMHGVGMLAGGVILAVMILPTISSISREVLRAVPDVQREAALALGATRWEAVRISVLSYARSGIIGAVILGLGRALGETMAVTMVIGNRPEISASLFALAHTMAAVIANEFAEATYDLYLSALTEIGFLLLLVTCFVLTIGRLLVWRIVRVPKGVTL